MVVQDISFQSGEETLAWSLVKYEEDVDIEILFLHGAWWSNKERARYIAEWLKSYGLSSLLFDFSGHGDSTGSLQDSNLNKRIQEAITAMNLFSPSPRIVVGSSMGWYVALQLLKQFSIDTLILFAPAVYTDDALDISFGPKFSNAIRVTDSWKESTLWDDLSWYTGKLLLFIWAEDEVIPSWVIEYIDRCISHTSHKEIVIIPNCAHAIHRTISANSVLTSKIIEKIYQFIIK